MPGGDGGVRLHHGVRLVGRGVLGFQPHGRGGKRADKVAKLRFRRRAKGGRPGHRRAGPGGGQVKGARLAHILHAHQLRRRARLFKGLRHHHRDGLVVMVDLRPGQRARHIKSAAVKLAGVASVDHRQHAGRAPGLPDIDRCDAAFGDAGPDHIAIGGVRRGRMLFIGIGGAPGHLERAVDPVHRLADDLQLVDRIGACWLVKFHAVSLRAWSSTALMVRPTRVIL